MPRLGSRIDAVLVSGPCIFPIELKCGERELRTADYNQAWDYALDLKNFHKASHDPPILPVLVATAAERRDAAWQPPYPDGVRPPCRCGARHLRAAIDEGLAAGSGPPIDGEAWGAALYEPTPTIIGASGTCRRIASRSRRLSGCSGSATTKGHERLTPYSQGARRRIRGGSTATLISAAAD